jgi:hypothetical protein
MRYYELDIPFSDSFTQDEVEVDMIWWSTSVVLNAVPENQS